MTKLIKTILAATAVLGLASCEKVDAIQEAETEAEPALEFSEGHLVSSKLVNTIPLTEAYTEAVKTAGKYGLQGYDKITDPAEIPNFLYTALNMFGEDVELEDIPSLGLQVKIWTISYMTKGGFEGKEDVILNADVAFMTDEKGILNRKLESISVYNSTYNSAEGDLSYYRGLIIPMRAIHNALVVYPFYQGTYIDRGKHAVTPGEFLMKGRQSIDAVLAAIEFVDLISKEEKVSLARNYYSENMGISNGGGTSLAVHYLLENDAEMKSANEKVRLAGTFIGEGCCSYTPIIPRLMEDAPCPDEVGPTMINVDDIKPAAFLTSAVGAYYTWVIDDMDPSNEKLAKMKKDYFSQDFLKEPFHNRWSEIYGRPDAVDYVNAAIYGNLYWGIFADFDGLRIENTINPDLVKDGNIDKDAPAMQELLNLFKKNDDVLLSGNWSPVAPIHFKHSKVDEFVPIEYVDDTINKLSGNGANKNVTIEYMEESGHILGTLSCTFLDVLFKKHPCPIQKTFPWQFK